MIIYFKKIRQKLIDGGNLSKYFFYAIGEITLIVIGILLALYLDNLNSEKKIRAIEVKILYELNSNLSSSIKSYERAIQAEQMYLENNLLILNFLDNNKPYDESLDKAFGTYYWTISSNPIKGGYDYLKSKGIELISNDSLRQNISYLFENEFSILKDENEVWANNLQQNISYPYHVDHFRNYYPEGIDQGDNGYAKPNEYKALLEDKKFKSINAEIISNRRWNINSLQKIITDIKGLMIKIEVEIRNLENQN
jgi:hypothetical protein